MKGITIERVDQLTLQVGNPGDPAVRELLANIARNTTPIAFATGTLAVTEPGDTSSTIRPPAFGDLWAGQGGYYVGILPAIGDSPAQYMIAGEQESRLKWGPYTDVAGARSRHDGRANTAALVGDDFPAAQWCRDHVADGHHDFHLPSQLELFLASIYAPPVFEKDGWYWSSTQNSRCNAFIQDFEHGYSGWDGKGSDYRVRAVRWIPLST